MAFRLARVSRLRTHVRELQVSELERLRGELDRLECEREATRGARFRFLADEAARARIAPIDGETFRLGRQWESALIAREQVLEQQILDARSRIEAKRQEVVLARQEERKLLRLEDRWAARVREEDERRAHGALDEFAMQAHRRDGEGRSTDGCDE